MFCHLLSDLSAILKPPIRKNWPLNCLNFVDKLILYMIVCAFLRFDKVCIFLKNKKIKKKNIVCCPMTILLTSNYLDIKKSLHEQTARTQKQLASSHCSTSSPSLQLGPPTLLFDQDLVITTHQGSPTTILSMIYVPNSFLKVNCCVQQYCIFLKTLFCLRVQGTDSVGSINAVKP